MTGHPDGLLSTNAASLEALLNGHQPIADEFECWLGLHNCHERLNKTYSIDMVESLKKNHDEYDTTFDALRLTGWDAANGARA